MLHCFKTRKYFIKHKSLVTIIFNKSKFYLFSVLSRRRYNVICTNERSKKYFHLLITTMQDSTYRSWKYTFLYLLVVTKSTTTLKYLRFQKRNFAIYLVSSLKVVKKVHFFIQGNYCCCKKKLIC